MKKLFPIILFLCSLAYGTACPNTGYQYYVSLTVAAQSSTGTNQTNFPAVYIGNAYFKTVGNGGYLQSSTGIDVIFCTSSSGGNLLPYELVVGTYTPTTGAGEWWVQLPTVSFNTSEVIYAFFDHTSPTDHSSAASVWQNCTGSSINASGVLHFGTSGTLTLTDSTGNATMTNNGSSTAGANEINGGVISGGSSGQSISSSTTEDASQFTVTGWILNASNCSSVPGYYVLARNDLTSGSGYAVYSFLGGLTVAVGNGGSYSIARYTNSSNVGCVENYYAGTYNGGNATLTSSYGAYHNGVSQSFSMAGTSTSTKGTSTNDATFASYVSAGYSTNLDEVHVWPAVLTGDWILDEYNNQSAPATFFTTGTFQPAIGSPTQLWMGPLN